MEFDAQHSSEEEDETQPDSNHQHGEEQEEEVAVQSNSNSQDAEACHEKVDETLLIQSPSNNPDGASSHEDLTLTKNGGGDERASAADALRQELIHSVNNAYITSITKTAESDNSTVKFEGMDIRSKLLPTLQKIWAKHGNIVKNSFLRNGDMIARALESLATVVLILEGCSTQSLNNWLVDYLKSTLSDLQHMHFEVEWLVPFVKKAEDLYKGKPLVHSLEDLVRARARTLGMRSRVLDDIARVDEMEREVKAQAAEMRSKLMHKLAKFDALEKELKEDMDALSEKIPGRMDFDQLL